MITFKFTAKSECLQVLPCGENDRVCAPLVLHIPLEQMKIEGANALQERIVAAVTKMVVELNQL